MDQKIHELSEKVKYYETLQPHEKLCGLNQGLYDDIEKLQDEVDVMEGTLQKSIKLKKKQGTTDAELFGQYFDKANIIKEKYAQGNLSLDDKINMYRELSSMMDWCQTYLAKQEMIVIEK